MGKKVSVRVDGVHSLAQRSMTGVINALFMDHNYRCILEVVLSIF